MDKIKAILEDYEKIFSKHINFNITKIYKLKINCESQENVIKNKLLNNDYYSDYIDIELCINKVDHYKFVLNCDFFTQKTKNIQLCFLHVIIKSEKILDSNAIHNIINFSRDYMVNFKMPENKAISSIKDIYEYINNRERFNLHEFNDIYKYIYNDFLNFINAKIAILDYKIVERSGGTLFLECTV